MIHIIWPEDKLVPEETIVSWYRDAFENGDVEREEVAGVENPALQLEDARLITLHRNWRNSAA